MADKSINQLPVSDGLTDDGLLVVYQNSETKSIRGNLIKQFAQQGLEAAMAEAKASGEFDGKDGDDGQDGYTPVKGKDYFDGEDGKDGSDGVSPTITVEAITGGHKLTITDKNGTQTVNVMDGEDGEDGMGSGDMLAADYDPQGKKQDIFQYVSVQIDTHNEDPNAHAAIRQAASEAAAAARSAQTAANNAASAASAAQTTADNAATAASNAQTTAAGKADKASIVTATLAANGWADGVYILSVNGVTATSNQELLPAVDITAEQLEALQAANIQDGGQTAGNITLKAYGDVPTIDIPIRVIKRGD